MKAALVAICLALAFAAAAACGGGEGGRPASGPTGAPPPTIAGSGKDAVTPALTAAPASPPAEVDAEGSAAVVPIPEPAAAAAPSLAEADAAGEAPVAPIPEPAVPEPIGASGAPAPAGDAGDAGDAMIEAEGEDAMTRDATLAPAPTAAPAAGEMPAVEADGDGMMASEAADDYATEASERTDPGRPYVAPSIEAGEVDDNLRWQEYLDYRRNYLGPPVHDVDVSERYVITVSGRDGRPVPNAQVRVSAGEAVIFEGRTYANGKTLFFPRAFPETEGVNEFRLHVEKGGAGLSQVFRRDAKLEWAATLDVEVSYPGGVPLDVLFLLDATGSMADEIAQLKATLLSISSRISDLPSQPDLRFGMVTYRDRGDEFITRVYDFTSDVSRFLDSIRGVTADAGGDTPESLNEALHDAVHEPEWRLGDAIRLVFLLADAPPHLDYQQDYDYAVEMGQAHRRGIKIFSIASSGLDSQGEYIFRQIAQHTMGRFIFIVYGGGAEGPSTPHDVSDYTVERLDDLVVRLVQEELAAIE